MVRRESVDREENLALQKRCDCCGSLELIFVQAALVVWKAAAPRVLLVSHTYFGPDRSGERRQRGGGVLVSLSRLEIRYSGPLPTDRRAENHPDRWEWI